MDRGTSDFFKDFRSPGIGRRIRPANPLVNQDYALRTAQDNILFAANLSLGKSPYLWSEVVSGAGASSVWSSADIDVSMSVSQDGDYVLRQTREWINYQAGRLQDIQDTGDFMPGPGVITRIGPLAHSFTAPHLPTNGLCLESIDGVLYCTCFKNGEVRFRIPQNEWNVDTLDGSKNSRNPSGLLYRPEKFNLSGIGYKWLGGGDNHYYCEIDGTPIIFHRSTHFNEEDDAYMKSGTLPVSYEIRSTGGTGWMR